MRVGDLPHAPAASTSGKDPVPILQEAGWAPGPVWTGMKSRPHRDSIPDRLSLSQSLYRLSCPAHKLIIYRSIFMDNLKINSMTPLTRCSKLWWSANEKVGRIWKKEYATSIYHVYFAISWRDWGKSKQSQPDKTISVLILTQKIKTKSFRTKGFCVEINPEKL